MDRTEALKELPPLYARALDLSDLGLDNEAIADRLGLPPQAVGTLVRIGLAKLAQILAAAGERDVAEMSTASLMTDQRPGLDHRDHTES